jgi:GTP-binding protein Era
VAIVGRPNAGKSTLLNRLVGEELAVVTDRPQTTRNRILAVKNLEGAQLVLVDTPGFHRARSPLNRSMVRTAVRALLDVDVALVMVELANVPASAQPAPGKAVEVLLERVRDAKAPAILALNKVDRVKKPHVLRWIEAMQGMHEWRAIVPISALSGDGVAALQAEIIQALPEGEALYPAEMLTDRAERFFIAELVREQVILHSRQEVPYATAVEVEEFKDLPDKTMVRCVILVERPTQKGILVGRAGRTVKAIGTAARQRMEAFLGRRVDLRLHVRVEARWTRDAAAITRLGYEDEP